MPAPSLITRRAIAPAHPIMRGLMAYWTLSEPGSLARIDQVNGFQLTTPGTVSQLEGKIGFATDFDAGSNNFLEIASNPTLQTGEIDFTIALWVKMDQIQSSKVIAGRTQVSPSTDREWALVTAGGGTTFQLDLWNTTGGVASIGCSDLFSVGTWHFVVAGQDVVANSLYIQQDNGTVTSVSPRGLTLSATSSDFSIGAFGDNSNHIDGKVQHFGFWKRALTSGERSWLWNGGVGRNLFPLA